VEALILTGPPGAGKSTVAGLLAVGQERAVHLEADRFFHFIVSGYIEPWRPESNVQNETVMTIVSEAAQSYARAGYFTIVDGIFIPGWFLEPTIDAMRSADIAVSVAILLPSLATCLDRARRRTEEPLRAPAAIEQLWNEFNAGSLPTRHHIANEDDSPERTADIVADRRRRGDLRVE
jgi:adenylate kinase family enzyme